MVRKWKYIEVDRNSQLKVSGVKNNLSNEKMWVRKDIEGKKNGSMQRQSQRKEFQPKRSKLKK